MTYYTNTKNRFGKTFEAKNDVEAVAYAEGYGYARSWECIDVYCRDMNEYVVRYILPKSPDDEHFVTQEFIEWHKWLFN